MAKGVVLATFDAIILIGLTGSSVLYFFLLVLFLGVRHARPIERILFVVFLCAFLYSAGNLLLLNAWLARSPQQTIRFAILLLHMGLTLVPAALLHAHLEYQALVRDSALSLPWLWVVSGFYAWCGVTLFFFVNFGLAVNHSFLPFWITWQQGGSLVVALLAAAGLQGSFWRRTKAPSERSLHAGLLACFALPLLSMVLLWLSPRDSIEDAATLILLVGPVLPAALLSYWILRRGFLGIAVRRNVAYVVVVGFLAVLYLTLVNRVSEWLAPWFPPVATTSTLVFALVFLFEPLQRALNRSLEQLLRGHVDKLQRLMAVIQEQARHSSVGALAQFIEKRVAEEFGLAAARLSGPGLSPPAAPAGTRTFAFPLAPPAGGVFEAHFYGRMISGDTQGALAALAAQLPAALDLCRLIEDKLRLERELAERERLALLGQMAASISHNLKNPLGSMKTLLQVQLEKPVLPADLRKDCAMVVAEIDRLSGKLSQLLQYSRPALRSGAQAARVDPVEVTQRLLELLRRDAAQRGIALLLERPATAVHVHAPEEALSDIFQNLVVNAVEAAERRGTVRVSLAACDGKLQFTVADDGPGIPPELQARIFQPFFTTKTQGTGLGLAIVQRRLAETGGSLDCTSPLADGRGTRFVVTLPLAPCGDEAYAHHSHCGR
jgi:signal transduction histidine kinase